MNTFCVEAFADYCDEMMIAEEGFIETIKEKTCETIYKTCKVFIG